MPNMLTGRSRNLKIPKVIEKTVSTANTEDDLFAASQAFSMAADKKFRPREKVLADFDEDMAQVLKIPENSRELVVITKAKKLGAYVIAITMKSPAKFRGVFVGRMQNFCLDAVQDMLNANFIKVDNSESKKKREEYQTDAIIKLKMLAYVAMLAENAGCILSRQYRQIAVQIGETVNLAAAWKKSDDEKWRNKQKEFEAARL